MRKIAQRLFLISVFKAMTGTMTPALRGTADSLCEYFYDQIACVVPVTGRAIIDMKAEQAVVSGSGNRINVVVRIRVPLHIRCSRGRWCIRYFGHPLTD